MLSLTCVLLVLHCLDVALAGWRNQPAFLTPHAMVAANGGTPGGKSGKDVLEVMRLMQMLSDHPGLHTIYQNPENLLFNIPRQNKRGQRPTHVVTFE